MGYHQAGQDRLAQALGWFSLGLGLAEVAAPRSVARLIGVGDHDATIRSMGVREIASGLGILVQRDPTPFLWSRVAGDAMDLALLGAALRAEGADGRRIAAATAAVLGVTALDLLCANRGSAARGPVRTSITVQGEPGELERRWREFDPALPGAVRFEAARNGRGTVLQGESERLSKSQLTERLRRFKQLVETGEIATTNGQSSARNRVAHFDRLARSDTHGRS